MSKTIEIESTTKQEVEITPDFVAELFMNMDSQQQAEFFQHCHRIQREWREQRKPGEFSRPEMQWYFVCDALKESKHDEDSGWDFVLGLAAPFYIHFEPGFLGR